MTEDNAYAIGRLVAAMERDGWLDADEVTDVPSSLPVTISKGLARVGAVGGAQVAYLLARVGDIPDAMPAEQWADYHLGYWHFRAGRDRAAVDSSPRTERHELRLTPRQKAWLMDNGGNERVQRWIDEAMGPGSAE